MPLRVYRRVHFPGGTVNVSNGGLSLSLGCRGAHLTFGRYGVTRTIGLPGTGLFWTDRAGRHTGLHTGLGPDGRPVRRHHFAALVLVAIALWLLFGR